MKTGERLSGLTRGYSSEPRPLSAYLGLIGLFNSLFSGFLLLVRARRRALPERVDAKDIVLLGIATHKLSRLLAKDSVTSPLRAPFTTFKGPGEMASELSESPRGANWQRPIGELVT